MVSRQLVQPRLTAEVVGQVLAEPGTSRLPRLLTGVDEGDVHPLGRRAERWRPTRRDDADLVVAGKRLEQGVLPAGSAGPWVGGRLVAEDEHAHARM